MDECPTCHKPAAARPENPNAPFCSARCKTIDLGKWVSEAYGVPVEDDNAAADEVDRSERH
jgi:uncharacterized protein